MNFFKNRSIFEYLIQFLAIAGGFFSGFAISNIFGGIVGMIMGFFIELILAKKLKDYEPKKL